jgi:hypothetical protein
MPIKSSRLKKVWGGGGQKVIPRPSADYFVVGQRQKDKSKASCGLGPRSTWNTAWKILFQFVTPELFQRIKA